jgi:amino acid transporter
VLAKDGYLPGWLSVTSPRTGAPWVALLVAGVLYAACLGLGFKRLIELDVIIYGGSLALELVALVVLRVKDPERERPFRVPFGTPGAVLVGVPPMGLLVYSLFAANAEEGGRFVVAIVLLVVSVGVALYAIPASRARARARRQTPS